LVSIKSLINYSSFLVCHDDFEEEEETFIIQWIKNKNGSISWRELINEIQRRFGKLRPKNKITNFWYSRTRREEKTSTLTVNSVSRMHIHTFTTSFQPNNSYIVPLQSTTNDSLVHFIPPTTYWSNLGPFLQPILTTLQPNPCPPQFNAPYRMNPF